MNRTALLVAATAAATVLLSGCVPNAQPGASTVIAVESTESGCAVETDTAVSGTVTFQVANRGERLTEFYLLRDDEVTIVAEVEDIAPGSSRDLTVVAQPGTYYTVCKPGMVGDALGQAVFTVTDDSLDPLGR